MFTAYGEPNRIDPLRLASDRMHCTFTLPRVPFSQLTTYSKQPFVQVALGSRGVPPRETQMRMGGGSEVRADADAVVVLEPAALVRTSIECVSL